MTITPISAILTEIDRDAVKKAVATIKEKLPFLIDITTEERKALPKMGDKSRAFVTKALEIATQNPDFLPRSFDLDEMRKDVQLFEALYPLLLSLNQLQELVDDTCLAVGSEAYAAALQVYNYAKAGGQNAAQKMFVCGSDLATMIQTKGYVMQFFITKPFKLGVKTNINFTSF